MTLSNIRREVIDLPWYHDDKTDTYYFKVNYKENGKYKQILRRGFKTQKEVKAAMAEVENQVNKGTFVKVSKRLYEDFVEDFLEDKKRSIKQRTWENYATLMKKHILPMRKNSKGKLVGLGKKEIGSITARDILDIYNDLFETGNLSDENIQKCHTLIKDSFKQARIEKLISEDPVEFIKRPKAQKKEMQVWSLEESQQFLRAASSDPLYIVFLLALTTGMRQGEILGLRWKDVDFKNRIISVTQILNHDGKSFDVGAKTLSGQRPIRLDQETMNVLAKHQIKQKEARMKYADVFEDNGLVVCTRFGSPVSPRNVNRSFERIVEKINDDIDERRANGEETEEHLKKIRFHDLRHTHVTFLIKNRETPQAIAERLGWSDTRMIDKYAHIRPDIQEDVADTFGKSFYGSQS
ncbi:site-specific integrase [Paenibacillus sp. USDA918EY]|uniref:site-specific integrase n=1 Tax=Paenibacillus sp. USDA918EY TaxID=2689575 RepID=UPI0013593669|nr:site-specific integrase [Paenibacillus sp. USDA918EY]